MTIALAFGLGGCAPGVAGLVSGDVLDADGAKVIVVRGYGVQLRGAASDAGLTLGYARRTYVYPNTIAELPEPGRYYFWVPQPSAPPVAWEGQAIGLDLRASSSSVGLTLGLRATAVLVQVPVGETVAYQLRFMPDEPALTRLRYCRGEDACATIEPREVQD